jgi:cytochrome c553
LDAKLQEKIHRAMAAAAEDARRHGLNIGETMQAIADALINDPVPEIAAFQERHNRHVRRDLN